MVLIDQSAKYCPPLDCARCDHGDGVSGEYLVKDMGVLTIVVPDHETEGCRRCFAEIHHQVPGLLGDPGPSRVGCHAEHMHDASA